MIDKPCSSTRQGQTSHQQLQRHTHAHCAAFATPDDARAAWHVLITCLLWLGCWASTRIVFAPYLLDTWWAGVLVPAWLFLRVGSYHRAFTVMHDATHNALFSHPWASKLSSIVCGSLMLIDGPDWGKSHRQHHTVEGMEDAADQDPNTFALWTAKQWSTWPKGISKSAARIFRDPLFYFTAFPAVFVLVFNSSWPQRVTHQPQSTRALYISWRAALVAGGLVAYIALAVNWTHFALEMLAVALVCSYSLFLVQSQHAFEGVYLENEPKYNRTDAAAKGASCIIIPWWWRWATTGVEYHHIHHLNARVPGYRIKECYDSAPPGMWDELGVTTLTWRAICHAALMALWDEDAHRFVPLPGWCWLDKLLMPQLYHKQQQQQPQQQQSEAGSVAQCLLKGPRHRCSVADKQQLGDQTKAPTSN